MRAIILNFFPIKMSSSELIGKNAQKFIDSMNNEENIEIKIKITTEIYEFLIENLEHFKYSNFIENLIKLTHKCLFINPYNQIETYQIENLKFSAKILHTKCVFVYYLENESTNLLENIENLICIKNDSNKGNMIEIVDLFSRIIYVSYNNKHLFNQNREVLKKLNFLIRSFGLTS